jgi:GNAT superfamily N-acetyltransferase
MTDVRRATSADIDACAAVLAAAFHDDPGTVIFDPDGEHRARLLPPFFRNFVAASLAEDADIVVAGEPIIGVASWFGPDRHAPSPDALGAHGFGDVVAIAGDEAIGRMVEMVGELERQHAELTSGPHLRLEFFGVRPGSQRTGHGTALIEHGHRRADELGLPCYLETFTLPNVRYYERRGYELVHKFQVADGVPVYALVRPSPSAPRS